MFVIAKFSNQPFLFKNVTVRAYTVDFLHIMLSKLLMPEETLKTRERNQKRFTALLKRPVVC